MNNNPAIISPPHAEELEQVVLGSMLIDHYSIPRVLAWLVTEHFYLPVHQKIYKAINFLYHHSKPVDILTLKERLKQTEQLQQVGGVEYISSLTIRVASTAHIDRHIQVVLEKFVLRQLMQQSNKLYRQAATQTTDVFDLMDESLGNLISIRNGLNKKKATHIEGVANSNLALIEKLHNKEVEIIGIPTGFSKLDRLISGLQGGMKIEVAGRPGMGKSAFAMSIINHVGIELEKPVALFSLEMPAKQQELRLKAMRTNIPFYRLMVGNIKQHEWRALGRETDRISASPIFIDDGGSLNIIELRSKVMQLKHEHNIELLVIDYLQLMNGMPGGNRSLNRENEISQISRATKQIAIDMDIPVIEVSQLSRAAEQRHNKRPQLSDLRESGAIEQDADIVLFPYRPEYYGEEFLEDGSPSKGMAELIIAKHRNGACKSLTLQFEGDVIAFRDV